ncbi:FAD-binding oxidoreductase, putative [Geotalea daltonii FRC-32]|uniref:FAD-binding oxidoreductase, putative n=1 Tax=Geotalea daltonii (strain DSM 22248 / JCM 15807 / FRC-32) TaxID=316067 RepID=B9M683_GEODF|nr:NAD(P)/FAD-dependent oxidoreductase [Geotalea daltonii]ACM21871.1 FAD-binding oxidoreductase, putative [Geotalea daltonii FRC-32]
MPFLLRNLTLDLGESEEFLPAIVCARFSLQPEDITRFAIIRKGIDARKKPRIKLVYTIEFAVADEELFKLSHQGGDLEYVAEKKPPVFERVACDKRIVIVGMGPAGLFAALRLAEYGLTATIVERGRPVEERLKDVQSFWDRGELNTASNVQFGEGGAGTFSDGKLTTRLKDQNIRYVLDKFVQFGAPEEILTSAKPHIGTDRLRCVITAIRQFLTERGFSIGFSSRLTDIVTDSGRIIALKINDTDELPCDVLVLAPGHSARDTYAMLNQRQVAMEQKPFAIGLRVEHPQELINGIQYGMPSHPQLPAADYALAYNDTKTGRSAYSFCMCPGGIVVAGASEEGGVVTNGMSGYARNSAFANSALVATVQTRDFGGGHPLAGVEFQRRWERRAYEAGGGNYLAPAQNLLAFLGQSRGGRVTSTYRPGICETDLSEVLPKAVHDTLKDGVRFFERKMRGFITAEANLTGVETRTSAPLRILRGQDLQSTSVRGLYPVGEGAGHAGGIMSASLDGIRAADIIARL